MIKLIFNILNDKAGTKVRIVAFPVSEELASIRRMKAKKENKKTPDTAYLEMLSWSVFITTISGQTAGYDFIYKACSIRWRIEIIFKSWKSSMGFSKIHTVSQNQLLIILYARFIMIIICIQYIFSPARRIILNKMKKELSMLKVIPNEESCQNTETDKRNKPKSKTARQSTTGTGKILFLLKKKKVKL